MPIKLPWELATAVLRAHGVVPWIRETQLHHYSYALVAYLWGVVSRAKFTANGSPCTVKLMNVDMLCNSQSLPPPSTVRVYMYF